VIDIDAELGFGKPAPAEEVQISGSNEEAAAEPVEETPE